MFRLRQFNQKRGYDFLGRTVTDTLKNREHLEVDELFHPYYKMVSKKMGNWGEITIPTSRVISIYFTLYCTCNWFLFFVGLLAGGVQSF